MGLEEPLLLPPGAGTAQPSAAGRAGSLALPTPFGDAALHLASGASGGDGGGGGNHRRLPAVKRRAGGVLKDKHGEWRTLYDQRARTTVLVNVAGILERCNEQTLPALYKVGWVIVQGRAGQGRAAGYQCPAGVALQAPPGAWRAV